MKAKYKKKAKAMKEAPTSQMRQVAGTVMGGSMVGMMTPMLSNPSPANMGNATRGMVGMAVLAPMSGVAFGAIDNIYNTGKKKK